MFYKHLLASKIVLHDFLRMPVLCHNFCCIVVIIICSSIICKDVTVGYTWAM